MDKPTKLFDAARNKPPFEVPKFAILSNGNEAQVRYIKIPAIYNVSIETYHWEILRDGVWSRLDPSLGVSQWG